MDRGKVVSHMLVKGLLCLPLYLTFLLTVDGLHTTKNTVVCRVCTCSVYYIGCTKVINTTNHKQKYNWKKSFLRLSISTTYKYL